MRGKKNILVIEFLLLVLCCSCSGNQESVITKTREEKHSDSVTLRDKWDVLSDSVNDKNFHVLFNGETGELGTRLFKDSQNIIPIGSYHNTFNEPPYEIKAETLDSLHSAILVFTNQVQMGISQVNINLICFNQSSKAVTQECSFEGLCIYSDETGIDTMSGVKLYDYSLAKTKKDNTFKLEVVEYKPFKYEDEAKNKNRPIEINKKACVFSLND